MFFILLCIIICLRTVYTYQENFNGLTLLLHVFPFWAYQPFGVYSHNHFTKHSQFHFVFIDYAVFILFTDVLRLAHVLVWTWKVAPRDGQTRLPQSLWQIRSVLHCSRRL